uniref:Putative secreted protein n=1 Tax=Anopheles darlingi TaxID=43151 RepID=A0A2M4D375_ANODA
MLILLLIYPHFLFFLCCAFSHDRHKNIFTIRFASLWFMLLRSPLSWDLQLVVAHNSCSCYGVVHLAVSPVYLMQISCKTIVSYAWLLGSVNLTM